MLASSFSTRFLLRKNRRSRLPAPLGPLFCRPRHGSAAPGPQRQNPGPPRFQLGFCCAKTGAAGYRPHLLGLPRKIGRGISLRETTLCGCPLRGHGFATPHRCFAVPVTAPPRRVPNGKTPALAPIRSHFACGETARPVVAPAGGNVLATPFSLRSNVAPRSHPGACSRSVAFRSAKPRGRSSAPPGPMFWPAPLSLCSSAVPRPKPRPSSFSIRFFLRKNRRARPPAFGRRGVDKVRKYHFVRVVLSSAPLTLSPLYAPARPVFRNRPKEKAAAENRCGCGISFTFPVFPPMRNKSPRMLCHSHPFTFGLIPWGKQKRKARPFSFLALLRKAHFCPFCILSFLSRSRSRCRKADSYSYFAMRYNFSTASCSEPVCFSIK